MVNDKPNVQDFFLNSLRKRKIAVTVFLANGVKLQGNIIGFDSFCIFLRRDSQMQMVYKHAIATILPATDISLFEEEIE